LTALYPWVIPGLGGTCLEKRFGRSQIVRPVDVEEGVDVSATGFDRRKHHSSA